MLILGLVLLGVWLFVSNTEVGGLFLWSGIGFVVAGLVGEFQDSLNLSKIASSMKAQEKAKEKAEHESKNSKSSSQ